MHPDRFIVGVLAMLAATPASATTWYVTTTGSNSNGGRTETTAFRWPKKAVNVALPGDTILLKAGTYRQSAIREDGVLISRSGTAAAPITLRGYGGTPVIDCSAQSNDGGGVYCLRITGSHWRIIDIAQTGAKQTVTDEWSLGMFLDGSVNPVTDVIIERSVSYGNMGTGVRVEGAVSDSKLLNVDSHDNYDRLSNPSGGNSDGFDVSVTGTGNVVTGCRAWNDTDDGFDTYDREYPTTAQPVTLDGNWSFKNGYVPSTKTPAGDGIGFKMGWNSAANSYSHNLSFLNRYAGFDSNQDGPNQPGAYSIKNNTSFKNGAQAYAMDDNPSITLGDDIAIADDTSWLSGLPETQTNNSWQDPYDGAVPSDFQSVDPTGTDGPRQADGSLPALAFLHPVVGGRLAGIGAYVDGTTRARR